MKARFILSAMLIVFAFGTAAFAADNSAEYSPAAELIYQSLNVAENLQARCANSLHFSKQVGRLSCSKTVAKIDNVVVGYACDLAAADSDEYLAADEALFNALNVNSVYAGRGVNLVRYTKTVGNLACTQVVTKVDQVTVGTTCDLFSEAN